jgi:FkbM family methyltransferase
MQSTVKIRRVVSSVGSRLKSEVIGKVVRPSHRSDLVRFGSASGGWFVPEDLLGSQSVCYLVGVGEDITFDLALIDRFKCSVHAFDPTPRASEHVKREAEGLSRFAFYPYGLWHSDSRLKFYAPSNPEHVSHSVVNLQKTTDYFEAEVRSLESIMRSLGHSRVDLLKIDIEGAEYAVLTDVLDKKLPVRVICVEFDQPAPLLRTIRMVKQLARGGYALVKIDGWNFTFISNQLPGSYSASV